MFDFSAAYDFEVPVSNRGNLRRNFKNRRHCYHTTSPSASITLVSRVKASIACRANVRENRDTPLFWVRHGAACRDCATAQEIFGGKTFGETGE